MRRQWVKPLVRGNFQGTHRGEFVILWQYPVRYRPLEGPASRSIASEAVGTRYLVPRTQTLFLGEAFLLYSLPYYMRPKPNLKPNPKPNSLPLTLTLLPPLTYLAS